MLQIKYFRGEGYNLQFMPDYRFYCDEKIQRPFSSPYYEYPYKTRIWYPYKNLRLYFDYMPSRIPFAIQRVRIFIVSSENDCVLILFSFFLDESGVVFPTSKGYIG